MKPCYLTVDAQSKLLPYITMHAFLKTLTNVKCQQLLNYIHSKWIDYMIGEIYLLLESQINKNSCSDDS